MGKKETFRAVKGRSLEQRLPDDATMQRMLNNRRLELGMTWAAFSGYCGKGISTIRRIASGEVSAHDYTKAYFVKRLRMSPRAAAAAGRQRRARPSA